jgi:hypothetical protein
MEGLREDVFDDTSPIPRMSDISVVDRCLRSAKARNDW